MRITKAPKHLKSVFKHFSHTTIFNIITKKYTQSQYHKSRDRKIEK